MRMSFLRSPIPGDQVVLDVKLTQEDEGVKAACRAEIGGEAVAEGTLALHVSED